MGMYDESWCASCGCSQPYSDEEVICGTCTSEAYEIRSQRFIKFLDEEYDKLWKHSLQLEKELDEMSENMESDEYRFKEIEDISNNGKILATNRILSVARGILLGQEKEGM